MSTGVRIRGKTGNADANSDVETGHEFKGEAIAICLAQQDPNSTAVWTLFVDAHCSQGWYRLGGINTNTIAVDGAAARVVGYASMPGADAFRVKAVCFTEGEEADLVLSPGKCCGGGSPYGVSLPPGGGTGPIPPPS